MATKGTTTMTTQELHQRGTHEEWTAARLELLKAEKELTRHSDQVAQMRQELPWVQIENEYRFETDQGSATLADLFQGRTQLLVYHFMFGPDFVVGCPSCTSIANGFNGIIVDLAAHDVTLWAVSRAPLKKLHAYKHQKGWTFPWASSFGSDFNFDFHASFTEQQQSEGAEYNFRRDDPVMNAGRAGSPSSGSAKMAAMTGTDVATYTREREGMSAFVIEDSVIYHTYSTYARGVDAIWAKYQWLDRAPKGRKGRAPGPGAPGTVEASR